MDERKQMTHKEIAVGAVIGFVIGSLFVIGFVKMNWIQIGKSSWTCTAIEQTGRNMDEVRCVRYDREKEQKSEKAAM